MENPKEPQEIIKEFFKLCYPNLNNKKLKTKMGFWLQHNYGRPVWTVKDLTEEQIIKTILKLNYNKNTGICCRKHREQKFQSKLNK